MLELGRINPRPKIQIIREKASVATVDGDNGLGLVVGPKANEIAMDKAEQHGSGWVSVCNTNHFGIAGYYPLKALERDLIGWARKECLERIRLRSHSQATKNRP